MNTPLDFLKAIADKPSCNIARYVYADWLEDQGDPQGEFIRLQCERELAGNSWPESLRKRESQLLKTHGKEWVKPLLQLGINENSISFRWGCVDGIGAGGAIILEHLGRIRQVCPLLRRLYIYDATDWLGRLSGSQHFAGLTQLGCRGNYSSNELGNFFAETPGLQTLKAMDFGQSPIGDSGLHEILNAGQFQNVMALDLDYCQVTWRGVRELLDSYLSPQLEWLNLRYNPIGDRGGRMLARTSRLQRLKKLSLTGISFNAEVARRIRNSWGEELSGVI